MIHPDELERSKQALRRAIENPDATVSLRTRIVRPDGQVRHIQTDFRRRRLRGKPQHGNEGELLGVTRDVTEEVERMEQQRMLAERLNMATEAAGVCCWEIDVQARRFLWIENPLPNLIGAHELGYSLDLYRDRLDPDDRDVIEATLKNALENDLDRVSYRYRVPGRSGRTVYVQTYAQIRRRDDGNIHMFGVSWDRHQRNRSRRTVATTGADAARRRTPAGTRVAVQLGRSLGIRPGTSPRVVLVQLSHVARLSRTAS